MKTIKKNLKPSTVKLAVSDTLNELVIENACAGNDEAMQPNEIGEMFISKPEKNKLETRSFKALGVCFSDENNGGGTRRS